MSTPTLETGTRLRTPSTPLRRRQLAVYGIVVAALVLPANLFAAASGADAALSDDAPIGAQIALFGQAIIPALAALLAWAAVRQRPTWGFRRAPVGTIGAAWLIGTSGVALGYAAIWLSGIGAFTPAGIEASLGGLPVPVAIAVAVIPGVVPWLLLAIGEELGWNSFLTVKLAERHGNDRVALLVGILWASFHLPLMLFVPGAVAEGVPVGWAAANFVVQCVALAFPLVWLRLRTGSIWPSLVLHGAANAALYLVAEPGTTGDAGSGWFIGEGGIITTAGIVVAVLATTALWRRRK